MQSDNNVCAWSTNEDTCLAGVIGTLYAARLQNAGHQVTILARASRLANIRRHGLVLEDLVSGARSATSLAVAERLSVDEGYDMALVSVRRDQLSSILPDLVRIPLCCLC